MPQALIVDDCRTTRLFVRRLVERLGFQTRVADSCAAARDLVYPGQPPGFVLVDWELPDGTGVELVRGWRSDPRLAPTGMIVMSVRDDVEAIRMALAAGANEYLMKPLSRDSIAHKLALLEFPWTAPRADA